MWRPLLLLVVAINAGAESTTTIQLCPSACTLEYAPVCASCKYGNTTFGNGCQLNRQNTCNPGDQCTKVSNGECSQSCDIICQTLYEPVCARCNYGDKTFGNSCELSRQNTCNPNDQCTKISNGECSQSCDIVCLSVYQPVCARCNYGKKTFGNSCELRRQNTCNPSDQCTKISDGECSQACDIVCLTVYEPVCALCKDGKRTFGNSCELGRQNTCNPSDQCSKLHDGACETVNPGGPICPSVCTKEYSPVCAQCPNEKNTFNNLCLLQKHNCQSKPGCSFLRDGLC